ncbi:MAG: CHAT domain-containing protein, partial [Chloroflexi bacterium]|nr:CHAT domain-containing protein [Chloroflexota bacterium]
RQLLGPARELNIGSMALPLPTAVAQALSKQEEKIYTYRVRVEETAVSVEHFDTDGNSLKTLAGSLTLSEDTQFDPEQVTREELQKYGQNLFNILFGDNTLRKDFLTFYEKTFNENAFLRLELEIDNNLMQDVALLPWELLHLPEGSGFGSDWLAASPELMLSKLPSKTETPTPQHVLFANQPIRIALIVGAHANTESPLTYEPIWEAYQYLADRYPEQFELLPLLIQPNIDKLNNLLAQQPHIIHSLVHAQQFALKGRDEGEVALILKSYPEEFSGDWMNGEQLTQALSSANPAVVLLQTNELAQPDMLHGLQDVAAILSQSDIPAVISWQFPLEPTAVSKFIHTVFPALAQGIPLDEAVQNGRRALLRDKNPLAFAAPSLLASAIVRRRSISEPAPPTLATSLGVAFAGDDVSLVLHKGAQLPATSVTLILQSPSDKLAQGLGYLSVQVFQGESTDVHENYQLADILLDDESLYKNDEIEIDVTLTVLPDGTIHAKLFHQSGFRKEETLTLVDLASLGEPSIIVFEELLDRYAQGVTENTHLRTLTAVSDWLNIPNAERTFILSGERGIGKTTIAALLAQYFRGERQPPNDLYALAPTSTSAVYFCQPSRPNTLHPRSFALTIASQWASRDKNFAYLQSVIDNHNDYELDELVDRLL